MARRMPPRDATEVYVSESGHICIKQEDPMGNEDMIVSLEPEQVPTIINWIKECMDEAGFPMTEIKGAK